MNYLTTYTSLSPIRRGFEPGFVNYKKGCIRLAATSDKVYQLLAHGQWFSLGTLASATTNIGRHDIAEILLKVALNTKNQIKSNHINKRKRMPKGKSNIDNPEKLATQVKDEEKQSKDTTQLCVGHHYTQATQIT